jgi:ATP-binding cassette subfamily B protein
MATRPPGPRRFLTEDERNNKPEITKELIFRILSYLKPYRLQFAFVFLAIVASSIIGLWPSIITGRIVDEALTGQNLDLLVRLLLIAFVTLVGSQFIITMESYINAWIAHRIIFDMKNQMYKHLIHMPQAFFLGEKQGDIITRMNSDIGGVSAIVSGTLTSIVSHTIVVITTMIAVFMMNWKLGLVGIVVIPLIIIPTRQVGRTRWKLLSESQKKSDEMNQIINETLSISGSMLVKLFTKEMREMERFEKANRELTDIAMKEERSGRFFRVMMGMFAQVGPLLIYFAGGYMMIRQVDATLTVGVITSTVILINRLYRPIQMLLNIKVDFVRSLALFSRIFEYFDRPVDIVEPPDPVEPEASRTHVVFDDVSFSYRPGIDTLKHVSFQVEDGATLAIVGPSGAGKSTIINLIPRLYDVDSGSVKVAGVDVRRMSLETLRDLVGFVSQDTYLFNGTIKENLLYANERATQDQLEEACRIADLHEFIIRQPDGYDTLVGNRGLKLSGGEKQRVSIARVVLKDPKILVLDEATSSLDSISENAIQSALEILMKHRTNIVIAHRLTTVLAADQIIVVDNGTVVESGKHEELLTRGGVYKQLFDTQFEKILEDVDS